MVECTAESIAVSRGDVINQGNCNRVKREGLLKEKKWGYWSRERKGSRKMQRWYIPCERNAFDLLSKYCFAL